MSRWVAALPLVVLAVLAILFAGYGLHHDPHVIPKALVGKETPDLALPNLDDGALQQVREASRQGPVLINFFASWCGPCQIEHPVLMDLQARHVRIVGIAYKDDPQNTKAFLAKLGDPFSERLVDRDGRAGIEFGVSGVPETYVVAQGGEVLAKYTNLSPGDVQPLTARMLTGR
ncbi:DsbE family thiol:disulfide interchange protein [Phenylobacterium sp.]|jgi:cytochrome c biogenesis protein CcmG/thiol:disulfide interchange protein DsbE|uniref:DsbE family thiol:disulfide interchange protein n=1 Tax=Phenylobacterium sp. TaxID=1871053 RepID=UPI002F42714C